jgi:hypothetical protein
LARNRSGGSNGPPSADLLNRYLLAPSAGEG